MADAQDGTITDKDSNDFLTDNMGMVCGPETLWTR